MALAREFGVLEPPAVDDHARGRRARDDQLELVHDDVYLAAVDGGERAARGAPLDPRSVFFGLGTADDPVFPRMHEAARWWRGATLAAAAGGLDAARPRTRVNIAGGLHHAMRRARQRVLRLQRPGHRHRAGCWSRARSGSPTWTSTSTTATGCRRRSTTIRGC